MAQLNVSFLGKELKNPLVIGSCPLTGSIGNLKKAADLGVGGVVLKSLFEEELRANAGASNEGLFHPEAYDASILEAGLMYGHKEYLDFIADAKKAVDIPVFASVNCTGGKWWKNYAADIASAGADGLELNISYVSFDPNMTGEMVEARYLETVQAVKEAAKIPVSVKIGPWFSSLPNMVKKLKESGADAVTLFNRYYQLAYDVEHLTYKPYNIFSTGNEFAQVFRWIAIISATTDIQIAATTGVHTAKSLIQQIIAGASVVQVVSALYKQGFGEITTILTELEEWMNQQGFASIEDFRGLIAKKGEAELKRLERLQYVKIAEGNF